MIKALLLGKYCIIMIIFWVKLFLPALFPFYSSIYFRERFLVAVLVEIWFTCFNSVGKTSNTKKKPFFFFFSPVPFPVIVFYTLYSSTQCLLFESCKNRIKQVGLRAFSAWQASGWQGRDGGVAGKDWLLGQRVSYCCGSWVLHWGGWTWGWAFDPGTLFSCCFQKGETGADIG